jgi:L-ribulose-5-phosphate 3-epimerase
MASHLTRRDFLAVSAAAGVGMMAGSRLGAAEPAFKTTLRKSLIGSPKKETFLTWKAAGFEGMETAGKECWAKSLADATKDRLVAEKCGMRIHSVLFGWANFNDPSKVAADIEDMKTALHAAKGYGADAVLLVPCRLAGMAMPEPWEFDIEFDEKTGHIKKVVQGDNAKYQAYIDAHNQASDATREAVQKLIPTAEKTGVTIALENVWNNLWVKPAFARNLVASFDNRWVRSYFDIGNHVKYAPSEEWIRTLGKLIVKCHVKDFKLKADGHGGDFVDIRNGSVDWPAVRRALDGVGYNGWLTIEGSDGLSLDEQSKRLDLILAGK